MRCRFLVPNGRVRGLSTITEVQWAFGSTLRNSGLHAARTFCRFAFRRRKQIEQSGERAHSVGDVESENYRGQHQRGGLSLAKQNFPGGKKTNSKVCGKHQKKRSHGYHRKTRSNQWCG